MLWSTFDGSSWETLWKRFSVLSGVQLSERVLSPDSKGDQFFENDILAINPRYPPPIIFGHAVKPHLYRQARS